jgi:alkaline phosphatase D
MLGNAQLLALEEWLLTSTATFKIVVSSVMWANFGTTQTDSWFGFQSERQRILDTVYDNGVEGVVIISGDQHWSTIVRNTSGDPPLVIYELEATPLAVNNRNATSSTDPSILFRDHDHGAYGVVAIDTTVSPATIKLTVCAVDLPCRPGQEPPPSTPLQAPTGANESIPVTVSLDLDDMGFVTR